MKLTAQEIAAIVEGTLSADPGIVVTGANALTEAGPGDISFIANPRYLEQAASTKAGLLLVLEGLPPVGRPAITVKNPQVSFAKILGIIDRERTASLKKGIHPSAVISSGARLGKEVTVG
ncbi:MAG: LpxD N-terminal domain-containing protein, partial [Endomicrobiales bacterium]